MKVFDRCGILAWALLGLVTCPLALAGPNCNRNPDHPACSGGEGGGITITWDVDNYAQYWDGFTDVFLNEEGTQVPRECLSNVGPVSGTGTYECAPLGVLQINLPAGSGTWTQTARNGAQGYCALLDSGAVEFRQFSPTRYWYGNHQGCDFKAGTCEVFASMWVFRGPGTEWAHSYFGFQNDLVDVGLIRIGGAGTVPAVIRNGVPEANPFSANQIMNIDVLTIEFQEAGKSKSVAVCEYVAAWEGEITFKTTVIPTP